MRNIDSYDSRYPLEYYEIGTIYSFYCSSIAGKFKKADSEYISKYSSKLLMLKVMFIGIHDGINNFFTKDYIINSW